MEIYVKDGKLRSAIEDKSISQKLYGADMTKKLNLRLASLRAAESLADFWPPKSGPERCHELKGNQLGVFSVDVKQPYRLLFKPYEPSPAIDRSDEFQRWRSITKIELLTIEDTHE